MGAKQLLRLTIGISEALERKARRVPIASSRVAFVVQSVKWSVDEYGTLPRPVLMQWPLLEILKEWMQLGQHVVAVELLPVNGTASLHRWRDPKQRDRFQMAE